MRRVDRQISCAKALRILQNGEYGVLATICEDEYTYATPLSYIYKNCNIYFHSALEGQKIENIKRNNKVSFCVVGKTNIIPEEFTTQYESSIFFGRCIEVFESEKIDALESLMEKYAPNCIAKGLKYIEKVQDKTRVFKIEVEHISGKKRE